MIFNVQCQSGLLIHWKHTVYPSSLFCMSKLFIFVQLPNLHRCLKTWPAFTHLFSQHVSGVTVEFILLSLVSSMPPPPPSLSRLSEEELRELEAEGRRGLEARLQCLQNIHTLLDAAMLNIHHYLSTVATLT